MKCRGWRSIVTALFITVASAQASPRPPNILWITCEDISPDLGCYGVVDAGTSNLDRFAAQGTRFTHCFSVAGVCAPSRSCIITGMYPTTLGTSHMRIQCPPPDFVRCFPAYLRDAGYYCTNNVKQDYNFPCPPGVWHESSNRAHYRNRPKGKPFFAVFNLVVTHESQIRATPANFAKQTRELLPGERHDPAKAQLPPYYPDTPLVRRDWANYQDLISAMDKQFGRLLKELDDANLADDTIVFFFSDHGRGLPRAKRWLYDSGLHVPLLIRWPGKLKAGSVDDRMVSFVDLAPTVLSLAGIDKPRPMQGVAFLGPKVEQQREFIFAARDRMDETYDLIRAVRDSRYRLIVNFEPEKPYAQHLSYMDEMPTCKELRRLFAADKLTGPQRNWFQKTKPPVEFYDTLDDPHETNNLADSNLPVHRHARDRLRAQLMQWLSGVDLGFLPEPDLHGSGFRRLLGDDGSYLDDRAGHSLSMEIATQRMSAVSLMPSAKANAAARDQAIDRLLNDAAPNKPAALRYWACRGLGQAPVDMPAVQQALLRGLGDPIPYVRVAAADALLRAGKTEKAIPTLMAALSDGDDWTRLLALNAICLSEHPHPELLPVIKPLMDSKAEYVFRKSREAFAHHGGVPDQSPAGKAKRQKTG